MADVGRQVLGLMAVLLALALLFAPLGAVLLAAARTGRGRVLAWAFGGSLVAGLAWLALCLGIRFAGWPLVAVWSLLASPWASAAGAILGWRAWRRREGAAPVAERRA